MTKNVESGAAVSETGESQAGQDESIQVSTPPGDERTSPQNEALLESLEQRLNERVAQEVERRFQSAKDKRWSELERQFGALSEFRDAMAASGAETQPEEKKPEDWVISRAAGFLSAAGLENDPAVTALLREKTYSPDVDGYVEMLGDLTELVLHRKGDAGDPVSPAGVAQPGGGTAPPPDLRVEYDLRLKAIRPGDVSALMTLKREFRKKGLDVY